VLLIPWYDIRDSMTGVACGAGNAYPSEAPDFTSDFHRDPCCHVFCDSLIHVIVLYFGIWVGLFLSFDYLVFLNFLLLTAWTGLTTTLNPFINSLIYSFLEIAYHCILVFLLLLYIFCNKQAIDFNNILYKCMYSIVMNHMHKRLIRVAYVVW